LKGRTRRGDDKMKSFINEPDSEIMLALTVLSIYLVAMGVVFLF
jgi:hypothetical protein